MIESLIRQAISQNDMVKNCVATYTGKPAVFYQTAPHDKDAMWDAQQYPRIDYAVDWAYNAERKTSGSLQVNIWCINEGNIPPEDIGEALVPALSDLFLTDETGTFCTVWNRTDPFDGVGTEPKTIGVTVSFDIVAFPIQLGPTPDPILSMMNWAKGRFPGAFVIGQDSIPPIWKPTDENPAVYFRNGGGESDMRPSHAVTWVTEQLVGHVICPGVTARQNWLRTLTDDMAIYQEITMNDGSPMLIKRLSYSTANNQLTQGQITVSIQYGVLRRYPTAEPLNHIGIR